MLVRHILPSPVLTVGLAILASPVSALGQPKPELPTWEPSEAMLGRLLSEESEIGPYRIKLPKGFSLSSHQKKPGFELWAWAGKRRPDGTTPALALTLTEIPARERLLSAEGYLDLDMGNARKARRNLTEDKPEHGRINGLTFARTHWRGEHRMNPAKMGGFSYVAVDGRTVITILSQDFEPHLKEGLELAEAAAQTLKKP